MHLVSRRRGGGGQETAIKKRGGGGRIWDGGKPKGFVVKVLKTPRVG